MTFLCGYGSGSGSADPCIWLMDPGPATLISIIHVHCRLCIIISQWYTSSFELALHIKMTQGAWPWPPWRGPWPAWRPDPPVFELALPIKMTQGALALAALKRSLTRLAPWPTSLWACITYKDDAGGPGLGRLEEVPDPPGALAHQHLVKLRARGVEEWNAGLSCYSAAKTSKKNVLRGVNTRKTTRGKHSICVISSVSGEILTIFLSNMVT